MSKDIMITHKVNNELLDIPLSYSVTMEEGIQVIACSINLSHFHAPAWLQLRKFQIRSMLVGKIYQQLFSDDMQVRNFDAVQFVDKAYQEIMKMEHYKTA
jgi:hypothetical protein